MTYPLNGARDDSDVPKFLTQYYDFTHNYLPLLTIQLEMALSLAPQEVFMVGLEGILISGQLFTQVRQQLPNAQIKLKNLPVKAPTFNEGSSIIGQFLQRVRQDLPQSYVSEAEQVVLAAGRRYAANVHEAAKALRVNLPQ